MSRYLKDPRGRFAGSIGDGRDQTPSTVSTPVHDGAADASPAHAVALADVLGTLTAMPKPRTCFVAGCSVVPRDPQEYTCSKHQVAAFARQSLQLTDAAVEWVLTNRRPGEQRMEYLANYIASNQVCLSATHTRNIMGDADLATSRLSAVPGPPQRARFMMCAVFAYCWYLPNDILTELASSDSFNVKWALAYRHRYAPLPGEALRILSKDPDARLRHHLLSAGELPNDVVVALKNDVDTRVAELAHRTNPVVGQRRAPTDFRRMRPLRLASADELLMCRTYVAFHASTKQAHDAAFTLLSDGWDGDVVSLMAAAEQLTK